MVNPLTTLSVVTLYVETLLIAYIAAQLHSKVQMAFIIFLLVIVISYVLTSTSSAFMVRTAMDFSGRYPGRALCFALHLCQLSLVWRFGKLLLLYDRKDWFELTSLRLIHIAVQTMPFLAIYGYVTFSTMDVDAVSILALVVALMSASISLTLFCVQEQLHSCSWGDVNDVSSSNTKRYCGVFLLLLGTTLALCARFACVILMSLVVSFYVLIPMVLHMLILIFGYMSCKAVKSKSLAMKDVLVKVGLSYLNIFDLVERDIHKVQCKYVSFYTVILVENIVMVAVWLLKSDEDYINKLIVIVTILALFICALVMKFASCSFIKSPSNSHLIQSETPDNATITEGKNIIKAISTIPSISSNVPHVLNNDIENINEPEQLGTSRVSRCTTNGPSSHPAARMKSGSEVLGVSLNPEDAGKKKQFEPRGNESTTDCGTYRRGPETLDSYSIDDPTHVSRYVSGGSSLVLGCQTGVHPKGNNHIPASSHRARERSEVSLDLCSSNSRNTNTIMTSVVETSQTSGVQNIKGKGVNNKGKKIIFPLGNVSSRWRKINLRLPSVSNFLVRSHEKKFKPYPSSNKTVTPDSCHCNDIESVSTSTPAFASVLHKSTTGKTDASFQEVMDNTVAAVEPLPASNTDSQTLRGQQLTKEDRVQLWLADMKRSKPLLASQYSTESQSSDCTCVPTPNKKYQDVPKFEDFLADVPPHPEMSFVVSSKPNIKTNPFSVQKYKHRSSQDCPVLHSPTQQKHLKESEQTQKTKSVPLSKQRESAPSKQRRGHGLIRAKEWYRSEPSLVDTGMSEVSCEQRHRPQGSVSMRTPDSQIQVLCSSRHKRSFSETCSESTGIFELDTVWLSDNQTHRQTHPDSEPIVPFIIKLGAMESLV